MSKQIIATDKAPAAIGTYSQAVRAGNTVYISGQIGLDPATMTMVEGFDAQTESYVDMIKAGIVDPAKVVRTALQDAGSIAALLITAEAMIADSPPNNATPAGNGGGMGGMGY